MCACKAWRFGYKCACCSGFFGIGTAAVFAAVIECRGSLQARRRSPASCHFCCSFLLLALACVENVVPSTPRTRRSSCCVYLRVCASCVSPAVARVRVDRCLDRSDIHGVCAAQSRSLVGAESRLWHGRPVVRWVSVGARFLHPARGAARFDRIVLICWQPAWCPFGLGRACASTV